MSLSVDTVSGMLSGWGGGGGGGAGWLLESQH